MVYVRGDVLRPPHKPICLILSCSEKAIYMWQNSIFYILHKYFSDKTIHQILEKMCIFDSSNAKPETPLMDFLYWSRFRIRVIDRCEYVSQCKFEHQFN